MQTTETLLWRVSPERSTIGCGRTTWLPWGLEDWVSDQRPSTHWASKAGALNIVEDRLPKHWDIFGG